MTANGPKMRAYQLDRLGSLDGLVLVERDIPSPGAGEVLVQVRASSLNFRDKIILDGWYPAPVPPGRVPLSDAAGDVVAVGAGVTRFKAGDRVINSFFPNWFGGSFNAMPEAYVVDRDGWLTEYKVISAEALVSMPEHLTFEEAATLPCAAVTAWSALSGVKAGETVLTQGMGGVSALRCSTGQGIRRARDRDDVQSGQGAAPPRTGGRRGDRLPRLAGLGRSSARAHGWPWRGSGGRGRRSRYAGAIDQGSRVWWPDIPRGRSGGRTGRHRLHDHVLEPGDVPADRGRQPSRS